MALNERKVSDEMEVSDRNFRSSYYKSLGFKDSEKTITHLEGLLKAEVFDVKKLRQFCLKHSLTVFYRPLVWKIILSVIPVYSDGETCSFVREHKKAEFQDLKRALVVMDKKEESEGGYSSAIEGGGGGRSSKGGSEGSVTDELTSGELEYHTIESSSSATQTSSPIYIPDKYIALMNSRASPRPAPESSTLNITRSSPRPIGESSSVSGMKSGSRSGTDSSSRSVAESSSSMSTSVRDHRHVVQGSPCVPSDFVTIYLLQNKRLLSNSTDQLKLQEQEDMVAIAEGFTALFEEEEEEDDLYWMFAGFMKKLESQSVMKENLLESFSHTLEEIDCTLLEHIKDLDALSSAIPLRRWLSQCYARDLPESCLGSVWDRVIGGSSMVLVYVAVAIILSLKRRVLSCTTAEQVEHLITSIPQENFGPIVGKAIKLWEDHGSPTSPLPLHEEQQVQEFLYEVEDDT